MDSLTCSTFENIPQEPEKLELNSEMKQRFREFYNAISEATSDELCTNETRGTLDLFEKEPPRYKSCNKTLYKNNAHMRMKCYHECYKHGMCKYHLAIWNKANPWTK